MRRVCSSVLQSGFRLSSVVRGRGVSGGAAVAPSVGGSGASALGRGLVVLLLALVGGFAFVAPGSAWATTGHAFVGEFGGAGNGDGKFDQPPGGPGGVAVMPSTGEVFAADSPLAARVQRFSADGVFADAFALDPSLDGRVSGLAVDPTGLGAFYVATGLGGLSAPAVTKYSLAGVKAYALDVGGSGVSLNPGARVAVDPVDGTVFVTVTNDEFGAPAVASFNATTGAFIASFDGSNGSPDSRVFQCPDGLAVDGSHRVYVLDPCAGRVDQYSAAGEWGATVDDGSRGAPSAVAVDPVSGEVYVSEAGVLGPQVTHFSAGGAAAIYTFDVSSAVIGVGAMAVSGAGTVYTSDSSRPFVQWFTRFEGPSVVTGGSSSVDARSAVLDGTIDPEGVDASYYFEYGTEPGKYVSRTVDTVDVGSGSDPVAASAVVTGLQPNKTYYFRIVGLNDSGSIVGSAGEFTTTAAPADVGAAAFASAIGPRSARLHGTVNPNNTNLAGFASTIYYFEYGTTAAYGSSAPTNPESNGALCTFSCGGDYLPAAIPLSGLSPGTTYHFRLVGDNGLGGPQFGADQTFTTAPAAGGGATDVTSRNATLTGTIDPHGEDTTYHFNYGPTSSYGARTAEVDGGSGNGEQQVTQEISGLSPDTTYHVQVVATSDDGVKRFGADGLFRTAPAPKAVAISPIGVSTGSATLVGDLDTYGLAGTYRFDVSSLDSSYEMSTVERAVAGNDGTERVSVPVDGLPAGEMFVVALVVTSNDSTERSDQVTFATASLPPRVFPPPPTGDGAGSYGCSAPRLDSYDAKPKPGDTITIGGRDLGAGGTAVLGQRSTVPADWSASGFELEIPEDASGTLGLTVDCGKRSNTVAIAIFKKPSSRFSIADTTVNGSRATLSVKVPGPGKLTSSAAKAKPGKVTIRKARGAKLVVKLNRAGIRALRKSKTGRLKVPVRVRYLPAGGKSATKTVTVIFKHTAGR